MAMNIHAESMQQYAEDAKHIDKPYLLWEICKYEDQEWHPCTDHPEWNFWELYRRKDCSFKANKHQKLMEQYAVDAKTSWSPYVNYQFKNVRGEWEYLGSSPSWGPYTEYRREITMKTVLINNKEVTLGARNHPTSKTLSEFINDAIDKQMPIIRVDDFTIRLNGVELWVKNYPYAYGTIWIKDDKGDEMPDRTTVFRLHDYIEESK